MTFVPGNVDVESLAWTAAPSVAAMGFLWRLRASAENVNNDELPIVEMQFLQRPPHTRLGFTVSSERLVDQLFEILLV